MIDHAMGFLVSSDLRGAARTPFILHEDQNPFSTHRTTFVVGGFFGLSWGFLGL